MELEITNSDGLNRWINERREMGRAIVAIKGPPPVGATYSDGQLITNPVNIAWKDCTSGEVYAIEYAQPSLNTGGSQ